MAERELTSVAKRDAAGEIVEAAHRVGKEVLAPNAFRTDEGNEPPNANFVALGEAGLLGMTVPRCYGGLEADPVVVMQVMETLARYCAATAFILTQHTGVCRSIAADNSPLAAEILPGLARGELLAGIGASQLRRTGQPMLQAERVGGGYLVTGTVPWASGYGLMTHIALGADLRDRGPIFLWVPFTPAPGISFGVPQDLAVMRASMTVTVSCEELFVPDTHRIGEDRSGYWRARHGGALSNPVSFVLGIGAACLDGLRASVQRGNRPAQLARVEDLARQLSLARERYYALMRRASAGESNDDLLDALLDTRVAITSFVLRLAETAIAAEGGAAHLRSNPAQRHLREVSFFLTATVNVSMREALVLGL